MGNICCTDEKSKPSIFSDKEQDTFLYGSDQANENPNLPLDNKPESNREESGGGTQSAGNINTTVGNNTINTAYAQAEAERQRALQEEQARLALIVSTAGRDMINLSSRSGGLVGNGSNIVSSMNGGNNGGIYYDPAYAATVAQDLIHGPEGKGLLALSRDIESNEDLKKEMTSLVGSSIPVYKTCVEDGMSAVEVLSSRIDYSEDLKATFMSQQSRNGISHGSGSGPIITGGTGDNFEDMDIFFEDIAERVLSSALCTKERLFQGVGPIVENLP